jgi:hypothetical protein
VGLTPHIPKVVIQRLDDCVHRLHIEKISMADSRFIYFKTNPKDKPK